MNNPITPCLWFDNNARQAAEFYASVFTDSKISFENQFIVTFETAGQRLLLMNGGPHFKLNPSVSFYVVLETISEVDKTWEQLLEGGSVLMPLDKYPWSEKYGWVQDKFGVNWQLSAGKLDEIGQKFTPTLMFTQQLAGQAEKAIQYYTSVFDDSSVVGIMRYSAEDPDVEGTVKHAQFKLNNQVFMAMDSSLSHDFIFNEAISFVVDCDTQEEIDYYWGKLSAVPEAEQCGWLKDQFGISWQIIPSVLGKLISDPDRSGRVINAFMQMKKFDIEKLLQA